LDNTNVGKQKTKAYLRVGFFFWRCRVLIKINGQESETEEAISIGSLVSFRKLPGNIIIELNGTLIARECWGNTRLNPGDKLEIVRIIGGG
jgi:sulfur carrier protein